jgi:hypothetical protein
MGVKDWRPGKWTKHGDVLVRVAGNLGDKNPFDYGGLIVFDVWQREPEHQYVAAEFWFEPEEGKGDHYEVYRFNVEPDVLKDLDWIASSDTGNWDVIAENAGIERHVIERMAVSNDPLERAQVYRMVGDYHGWENIDSYPVALTREEIEVRWPEFA